MRPVSVLSFGNFFASAHFFLVIYVLAPFLATLMPANSTGLVVCLGAIITLTAFPVMPRLVARYNPQRLALIIATLQAAFLLTLAISPTPVTAVLMVMLVCAGAPLLMYQLDLLLESLVTTESATGRVRTAFLTAGNAALVLSPVVIALFVTTADQYERLFLIAAGSLLPFIFLLVLRPLPKSERPTLANMRAAVTRVTQEPDLRAVLFGHGVLQFYYHLAPLFIPLYLHTALGMPWHTLGWVLATCLVPFVLLEYPAGWLADKRYGDKEFMLAGFVLMGSAFAAVACIQATSSLCFILAILITSRAGAALVEAMTEGHFFRKVSESDADLVSIFRMMRPLGALTAPLIGSILLSIASYSILFTVTGVMIVAAGVAATFFIRDIR